MTWQALGISVAVVGLLSGGVLSSAVLPSTDFTDDLPRLTVQQQQQESAFLSQPSAWLRPAATSPSSDPTPPLRTATVFSPTNLQPLVEVPLLGSRQQGLQLLLTLNHQLDSRFLLDTGSSYTIITPALASRLGLDPEQATTYVSIATANGVVQAPRLRLTSATLNGYSVHNLDVVVQPLSGKLGFEGLLGLNFFKDLEFTVKTDRLVLNRNS